MSCVENLATFVCRSAYEHLSETARRQLKIRMLHSLRCAVGALDEPVQILRGPEEDWATYSEEDKDWSEAGFEEEVVREGETVVGQARELWRSFRVSVTIRIDEGNPPDETLSEAERGPYDLVVRAIGACDWKRSMLGSLLSKIAWNAPCSVLIVKKRADAIGGV